MSYLAGQAGKLGIQSKLKDHKPINTEILCMKGKIEQRLHIKLVYYIIEVLL
jgi:hypothetical protein